MTNWSEIEKPQQNPQQKEFLGDLLRVGAQLHIEY